MTQISAHGYIDSDFDSYYERLSEDHFPQDVLINWVKTIVDDLEQDIAPAKRVYFWDQYFHSSEYANFFLNSDYVNFSEHEMAYLYGAVYYWLKCFSKKNISEDVFKHLEVIASRKNYAKPYFLFFKEMAEGNDQENTVMANTPSCLTSSQTALLWLAIAFTTEEASAENPPKKKDLAPVISQITGFGASSINQHLKGSFSEKDKKAVVSIIKNVMPKLAERVEKL